MAAHIQFSCLGYPTDREAWQATVHGVSKNWAQWSTQDDAFRQGLAKHRWHSSSSLLVNTYLLEHCEALLFMYCPGCVPITVADLRGSDRNYGSQILKDLQITFTPLCSKIVLLSQPTHEALRGWPCHSSRDPLISPNRTGQMLIQGLDVIWGSLEWRVHLIPGLLKLIMLLTLRMESLHQFIYSVSGQSVCVCVCVRSDISLCNSDR